MVPKKSKLWTKDFIIISIENLLAFLSFYLLMIVISGYAMSKFDSSPGEAGIATSIFVIGGLFMRLLIGKWMGQIGYKKTLYSGIIFSFITTLLYFGVNSIILLVIVRFLHGMSFGIITTATGTIIASIIPMDRRGEGISYYGLSLILATAVGPFLGIFITQNGSFNMIFVACTITSIISFLIMPFLSSLNEMELTAEQLEEMKEFKFDNFFETKVIPISMCCMIIYICYSSVVSFVAVYSQEINLISAASFFFIVYGAVVAITRPVIGRLFDSKGENSIMYPAILIFSIGITLFSQAHHGYTILLAGAVLGLGFGAIQSSTQAISVNVTPQHRMGLANSTYFAFTDIGMGIGPLLVGLMIPFFGYRGMYMVMAIVAAVCLLVYYLLHGKKVHWINEMSVHEHVVMD
ncbi:MFS transporter [Methanococcoides sp. FTZ1]|uniref:MFS transporter n=1 Tax=Methanococcoides sp. FTZ1 TaxID=3439061 RepID=UPI003F87E047